MPASRHHTRRTRPFCPSSEALPANASLRHPGPRRVNDQHGRWPRDGVRANVSTDWWTGSTAPLVAATLATRSAAANRSPSTAITRAPRTIAAEREKSPDARVQVHDVVTGADAADHVGNKVAQQKTIALEKCLHVPPQPHLMPVQREHVSDMRIADENRRRPASLLQIAQQSAPVSRNPSVASIESSRAMGPGRFEMRDAVGRRRRFPRSPAPRNEGVRG